MLAFFLHSFISAEFSKKQLSLHLNIKFANERKK